MNIKLIIFSGLTTAVLGAFLGTAAAEVTRDDLRQVKYEHLYQDLYDRYTPWIGAGLGLAIGTGQQCLRELDKEQAAKKERSPH
ncbi:MAG: hypothetical protein ACFB4I_15195 [Cyanophyceae cyanobacterium]